MNLQKKYGKGFTRRALYNYIQFYKLFPQIVRSLTTQSTSITSVSSNRRDSTNSNNIKPITHSLLSWTHYEKLLQVDDENARSWYEKEAYEQTWSVRTLQRNISSGRRADGYVYQNVR